MAEIFRLQRQRSFSRRMTMSAPPVDAPARNTRPQPTPVNTPPYSAPSSVSVWTAGSSSKSSIQNDIDTEPMSEPIKNRLPIFLPAMMNRGILAMSVTVPTELTPVRWTKIIARPDRPPALMS